MFFYYYDWTYMLVVIGAVICLAASARVNRVFARYSHGSQSFRDDRAGGSGADPAQERDL